MEAARKLIESMHGVPVHRGKLLPPAYLNWVSEVDRGTAPAASADKKVDRLSDKDQKAVVVALDSLVKRRVRRVLTEWMESADMSVRVFSGVPANSPTASPRDR
jgi:hypothetical protein